MNIYKERNKIVSKGEFWIVVREEEGMPEDLQKDELTKSKFMANE